ncbi:MAG TPA: EamA family transporter [Pseudonocardiaceae bacterium]
MTALLLSMLAAAGYGISDFVGGVASRRAHALQVVIVSYPLSVVAMFLLALLVPGSAGAAALAVGLLSGVFGGIAVLWFYIALAEGPMSVVSPLTALLVAGLPLGAGMLLGERPGPVALCGAALAVIAVVLVSRQEQAAVDETPVARFTARVAWLTVGSGAAFGVYFVTLDQIPVGTGLWPLVASRVSATVVVVLAALVARERPAVGGPARLATAAAALDVLGNVAFLYALQAGLLSLVSVIGALYPAWTVLLARLVLGERTNRTQQAGLVLAALAVGLIAGST